MRVKRFVGDTVSETIDKVKRELGPEAVILQTQKIREGGILGLFGRVRVEITAAIDSEPSKENLFNTVKRAPQSTYSTPTGVTAYQTMEKTPEPSPVATAMEEPDHDLKDELRNMHNMLEDMNRYMQDLDGRNANLPLPLQKWAKMLRQIGVNDNLINHLLKTAQQNLANSELEDAALVRAQLEQGVKQICSRTATIKPGVKKPKIVALVGPTGVGKTTTIGKLAAGFSIGAKKKVAMVTADTFRVAAVEQLKTFGQIIGVPVEVANSPNGLSEAIAKHADKEIIFVDTAGRSPQHQLHMHELKAYLDKAKPHYTILVISATTQFADQQRILKQFKPLSNHLIITKADETICPGTILNLLESTTLPIAYITNGQNVPDDISAATSENLTQMILEEVTCDA